MPSASAASVETKPELLLTLPISAYHPTLSIAEDAIYLLTEVAAYRVVPGAEPEVFQLDLGHGAALTQHEFVFWSAGAVYLAPKLGGARERVVTLAHEPQYFVANEDHFAWLDHGEDGGFAIQTVDGGKVCTLLAPQGQVVALTLMQDWAFFVEVGGGGAWRIGGVRQTNQPVYGSPHTGRPPSMLASAHDKLYYYDGPRSQISELSPDLQHERAWVKDVICSPIAVSNAAYCGSVEGVFTISEQAPARKMLEPNGRSMVAAIVANDSRVAWLRDAGPDQLALETLAIAH
ncbi:MAG TPA: hypothetical protein VHV51_08220 [Polyangiaceae bacterium]|jgi:hypothetical protein|nr:hypothetical protein [Polyangiaceae bacterium]